MDGKYIIYTVTDKDGNKKSDIQGRFHIKFAKVGRSAILLADDFHKSLQTSRVEDISIWENGITITTRNSVYVLELV